MNTAITTTEPLAALASTGTPSTPPAEARISPRTNSPITRPRMTITMALISVGMNAIMIPNIRLMLSSPSAADASRITISITSQNSSLPTVCTGSSPPPAARHRVAQPAALRHPVEVHPLQGAVDPPFDLPRHEIAGEEDDRGEEHRGKDRAELLQTGLEPVEDRRSRGHLEYQFAELFMGGHATIGRDGLGPRPDAVDRSAGARPRCRAPPPRRIRARCPSSNRAATTGTSTAGGGRCRHRDRWWRRSIPGVRRARAVCNDRAQVAVPTESTTTSARPPKCSLKRAATSGRLLVIDAELGAERFRGAQLVPARRRVTAVLAPMWTAICSAARATPPPMPQISTRSPACSRARVVSIRQAVSVDSVNAAAAGQLHSPVSGRTFRAGSTISSAAVPGTCSPRTPKRRQNTSSPARHASHSPHETPGLIATRSPGRRSRTAGPVSRTTPAPSDPTMWGKSRIGTAGMPSATRRSR